MYCSASSLNKWLDYIKRYVNELQEESGSDNIYDVLHDGNHDGYIREFKSYIKALPKELDIKIE